MIDTILLRRLVFVGRILFMYLTEQFKLLFGKLLCADDHSEFKVCNECSIMLRKKGPCKKSWSLSLSSGCE